MAKKVKLADIAERVGVSTVTVSKALSGQKGVSEDMRDKIREIANELGYQSPTEVKQSRVGKSYNIGVIISERYFGKIQTFYYLLYQAIATKAVSKECFTMLEIISLPDEARLEKPKLLEEKKVDGLIVMGSFEEEYLKMLNNVAGVPFIFLDFYNENLECDAVIGDNYFGMYKLAKHVCDMGHRKIAYVGTVMSTKSITDRYFGYCKALVEHGIELRPDYVVPDRSMDNHKLYSLEELQLPKDMPTAFVCNSDITADLLIEKLRVMGYMVPEDISVVGFDNYSFSGAKNSNITTYEVDVREMARKTINTLLKKLNGEYYKRGTVIVEGKPVFKDSVKRIN